jgi:hypothetical protein
MSHTPGSFSARTVPTIEGRAVEPNLLDIVQTLVRCHKQEAMKVRKSGHMPLREGKISGKGYELDVKTHLEVQDAEMNLLAARSNPARAERDYHVARVALAWAAGPSTRPD